MYNFYRRSRASLALLLLALVLGIAAPDAKAQTFIANLSGDNEVPPVDTEASGIVAAVLDGLTLTLVGNFDGLESDYNANIGSHIHTGGPEENGPVIIPLDPTLDGDNRGGTFEAANNEYTLTQEQADNLAAGNLYVNVHSIDNPGGEVRGQLVPSAGGARLQVIHNAADPGAAVVDVYIEEVSADNPILDDFAFRTATPFLDLPADTPLTVTVAGPDSESAEDGLASFEYTLVAGETYQLIANGVLDPTQFEANPSGESIAFTLFVNGNAQESADSGVAVNVVHGSTDAPTVDVIARARGDIAGNILVDDATYGDITDYLSVPAANYVLDVTPGSDNDTIVASFAADLSGAEGAAITVLASGFLSPGNDQDGPTFGLLAVFADGTTALLPAVTDAQVQVIHNAADPGAAVVDVYIEEVSTEDPALDDFAFRTATPFLDLPAGTPLTVTVAGPDSENAEDGLASFEYTLVAGAAYQLIANGVLDPSQFEANPNGEPIAFTLFVTTSARQQASDDASVAFNVVHGSTDAPTVDVVARDVGILVDDATYGDITPYNEVPAGGYTLDITPGGDNGTIVATFAADLNGAGGGALTVLASGFLSPGNDQDGPAFGLLAVFPDGTAALLPTGVVSNEDGAAAVRGFSLIGSYPNPFRAETTVRFDLAEDARVQVEVYDVLGRRVLRTEAKAVGAGAAREVRIDGGSLPSGAYLYRLTAETAGETLTESGRFTIVR